MNPIKHHPDLSPSSLPALARCGHYRRSESEEQRAPNGPLPASESPYAQRGTRIDKLFINMLEKGREQREDPGTHHPDEEWECARWIASEVSKLIPDIRGLQTMVEISDMDGGVITFGTCDAWGYHGDELILCDGKSGIFRDYSAQQAVYALGLMDKEAKDTCHAYCVFGDLKMTEEYVFQKEQCEAILREAIAARENPDSPYNRNPYCEWCSIRPKCPAWLAPASLAVSAIKPELGVKLREGLDLLMTNPALMGEFYSGWLDARKVVEDYDIPGKMLQLINGGIEIDGWTIRNRRGARHYSRDAIKTLIELGEINCLKVVDSEVDKLLAKHPEIKLPDPYVSPDQRFVTRTRKTTPND